MADRVPDRYLRFDVAVPASTAQGSPVSQVMGGILGTLADVRVIIPRGHAGQTGIRFEYAGAQLVPWASGWIVGFPDDLLFEVGWDPPAQAIVAKAYNTDTKAHTFYVALHVVAPVRSLVPVSTVPDTSLGPPDLTGGLDGGGLDGGGGTVPPPVIPPPPVNVPQLVGRTLAFAEDLLAGQRFILEIKGPVPPADVDHGSVDVVAQHPAGLTPVPARSTVEVAVAWPGEFHVVPDVVGRRQQDAVGAIRARGFRVEILPQPEPAAPRFVVRQRPRARRRVVVGAVVTLHVEHRGR